MPSPSAKNVSDLHRLLRILVLLRGRADWTPGRLARELGVTERTVYRDVDKLKGCGIPVRFDRGRGYMIDGEFFLPPVQLTAGECLALTVLCEDIAGRRQIGALEPAYRALEKIEAQLPEALRREVWSVMDHVSIRTAPGGQDARESSAYDAIRRAIAARRALDCVYAGARGAPEARFELEPYALLFSVRAWYVIGRRGDRGEVRTLKLSRFRGADPLERAYEIPAGFSIESHLGNAWRLIPGERDHAVELWFDPEVAENVADTQWHATQSLERPPGGGLIFRCTVRGLDEILWWILGYGHHCTVRAPEELARRVRESAERTAALYAQPARSKPRKARGARSARG